MNRQISVALAIIINEHKQFLLTLRNDPHHPSMHLKWELPGGGIEKGEALEQAVVREVREEIGASLTLLPYPPITVTINRDGIEFIFSCFMGTITGRIVPDMKETLDARWIMLPDLSSLDYLPKVDEMLKKANTIIHDVA
jgi:8-oxo-dGTP diphosphatase